jgi:hypothetical protein
VQDRRPFRRDGDGREDQGLELTDREARAPGDRAGQRRLGHLSSLEVLAVQSWLDGHQRTELIQPAGRQAVDLAVAGLPGNSRDDCVGERLFRRARCQAVRQPCSPQGDRPDDRRFLAREIVVEGPGRYAHRGRDLRNPHVGQAVLLSQTERGQGENEPGLLLKQLAAAHPQISGSGRC